MTVGRRVTQSRRVHYQDAERVTLYGMSTTQVFRYNILSMDLCMTYIFGTRSVLLTMAAAQQAKTKLTK